VPGKVKTIRQLEQEIKSKQQQVSKLRRQRRKLAADLAKIDRQIASLIGGAAAAGARTGGGRKRRRAKNEQSLVDAIAGVLKGRKGMRAVEIAAAVRKAGYKTYSKDFYGIVASTLRDKRFKRIRRGIYAVAK